MRDGGPVNEQLLNLPQIADAFGVSLAEAGQALQSVERSRGRAAKSDIDRWFAERAQARRERRQRLDARRTTVYLVYGETTGADPIYVGITGSKNQRLGSHRAAAVWWDEAAEIHLEHFDDRARAERRERELIALFSPAHNVIHNPKRASGAV